MRTPIAARTRLLLEVTGDTVFNDVQRPCSAMWLVTGLEGEEGRWSTHDRYSSPRLGRGVSCGFGRLLSAHADAVVSACGQWSRGVHHRVGTAEDRSYSVGSRRRRRIRSSRCLWGEHPALGRARVGVRGLARALDAGCCDGMSTRHHDENYAVECGLRDRRSPDGPSVPRP